MFIEGEEKKETVERKLKNTTGKFWCKEDISRGVHNIPKNIIFFKNVR